MQACWQPSACLPFYPKYISSILKISPNTTGNVITLAVKSVTKIRINWDRSHLQFDTNPILKKFVRWMTDHGYRDASIDGYLKAIGLYLRTIKTITPSIENAKEYHSNKRTCKVYLL
jgi:hypothetical protein